MESTNKLDLTGKSQHGFKHKKSTATAGALLQSLISRAADEKNFVLMVSLDLSMAFDLVNTELLVKTLKMLREVPSMSYEYFLMLFETPMLGVQGLYPY